MSDYCRHGQPLCDHGNCSSHCAECWKRSALDDNADLDAIDRWADDGGRVP